MIELNAYPALLNDASLVHYWRMEGNANDSKGSDNGTSNVITYSTGNGLFGQGAGVGVAGSIGLATGGGATNVGLPNNVGNFSIVAYIWGANVPSTIYSKRDDTSPNPYTDLDFVVNVDQTVTCSFRVPNNFTFYPITSSGTLTQNSWNQVIYTRSGSTGTIYINKAATAGAQNGNALAWGTVTSHGMCGGVSNKFDDVSMFTKALTQTEINNFFDAVGSSIKSINGLAKASVKSYNGLAIASVKTINGLA